MDYVSCGKFVIYTLYKLCILFGAELITITIWSTYMCGLSSCAQTDLNLYVEVRQCVLIDVRHEIWADDTYEL